MFTNPANKEYNELQLIRRYRETQDMTVMGILFDPYLHLVYGLCLKYLKSREDSQDVTLEIFEKVSKELLKTEITHFKSWLYILSKNECLRVLKHKQKLQFVDLIAEKDYNDYVEFESVFTLNKDDDHKKLDNRLKDCIEKLNEQQQTSIKLFYFKSKCYNEISQILDVGVKKVKSYIQNGKRNLKKCIEIHEKAAEI